MARQQPTKRNSARSSHGRSGGRAAGSRPKPSYNRNKQAQSAAAAPLLDDRAKRDIGGVIVATLGVVLFVMAYLTPGGMVSSVVGAGLKLAFGAGIFLLPFMLFAIAVTLLVRFDRERVPVRVALGLGIIYLALLALMSALVYGAEADPSILFLTHVLTARGGYVGSGIAWLLLTLFGLTVTVILLLAIVVIGCIVIGFSLSALVEKIRNRRAEKALEEEEDPYGHLQAPKTARIRLGDRRRNRGRDFEKAGVHDVETATAQTQLLGQPDDSPGIVPDASAVDQARPRKRSRKGACSHDAEQVLAQGQDASCGLGGTAGKHASKSGKGVSQADTILLDGAAPEERPMTRKLSGRRPEELDGTAGATGGPQAEPSKPKPRKKAQPGAAPGPKPQEGFELPSMDLLAHSDAGGNSAESEEALRSTAGRLAQTLSDFGIDAEVVDWVPGPTVTLFKVDLPSGVRVSRVSSLSDDIALALAAPGVRIFAPVPGTNYVGIEVPNSVRQTVLLADVLDDAPAGPLQVAIGKDVEGHAIVSDLAKMPHLLIGGTTGSGKSVSINGMIMSILMRATPAEVRFIMIDPKRVEFTPYNGIPHLYVPVVTESKEAASALAWGVAEMERRLKVFSGVGARNIGQFNQKVQNGTLEDEEELPYIVIIIDELADLMMNVGKEVEFSISRLAQLARAAGIHLIVATQRPSTNVVTGLIKANITNRIAFNVASGIDSRVILDTPGAEHLIGLGDLLLSKPELAKPQRIQGCYVSEDEIFQVVECLKAQGEPEYHNDILKTNLITLGDTKPDGSGGTGGGSDPLLWEAAEIVCSSGMGSTSNLQRRLSVGYSRAGRIMDLLEEKGVVGPPNGSKPREVLVDPMELETLKAFDMQDEH